MHKNGVIYEIFILFYTSFILSIFLFFKIVRNSHFKGWICDFCDTRDLFRLEEKNYFEFDALVVLLFSSSWSCAMRRCRISCRNETYCVLNNKASVRHHLSHHNVWTMMRLFVYRDFVGDHLHVLYINTSPFMPISQCSDMN